MVASAPYCCDLTCFWVATFETAHHGLWWSAFINVDELDSANDVASKMRPNKAGKED
jgi:hypothetical protein